MADGLTIGGLASQLVPEVRIRSEATPTLRVATAPLTDTSAPSWLMSILKPSVDLVGNDGNVLYTLAPYGDPDPNMATARAVAVAVLIVGSYLLAFSLGARYG